MEPVSITAAVQAAKAARRAWEAADAKVAAAAKDQGISKEAAWAGVQAEMLRRTDETVGVLRDLADPLGWRAAARAMEQAERDSAS